MDPLERKLAAWTAEVETLSDRSEKAVMHYELGHLLEHQKGDSEGAADHYRSACKLDPSFRPPLFALIHIYKRSGIHAALSDLYTTEAKNARTAAEEASALIDHAALLEDRLSRSTQARGLYERVLARGPGALSAALMLELYARGEKDPRLTRKAIESRAAHLSDPALKKLLVMEVAHFEEREGNTTGAIERLGDAATTPVERYRLLRALERLCFRHGRESDRMEVLEMMATLAEAHGRGRGTSHSVTSGALPPFPTQQAASHESAALWLDLAYAREHAGDLLAALGATDRALALLPGELLLRHKRMDLVEATQDHQAAIREGRRLLEHCEGPSAASLQMRLAQIFVSAGDERGAVTVLAQAVTEAPESPAVSALYGEALLRSGDVERRIEWLDERATRAVGDTRTRILWKAAELSSRTETDFRKTMRRYHAAVTAAGSAAERSTIGREALGAASRAGRSPFSVLRELPRFELDADELAHIDHSRYLDERDAGRTDKAIATLRNLLDGDPPPSWAAHALGLLAAESADHEAAAIAHEALSRQTQKRDISLAEMCVAARAWSHSGNDARARSILTHALEKDSQHAYANALMEEVLRKEESHYDLSLFLRHRAESQGRTHEGLLVRAGLAAERAGKTTTAADVYRQAAQLSEGSLTPHYFLLRLAKATSNSALRMEALELMARREESSGTGAGMATLALGEYESYQAAEQSRAQRTLARVLPSESVGCAAAVAALVSQGNRELHAAAFERLLSDTHGRASLGLRCALGTCLLPLPGTANAVAALVRRVTDMRANDPWAGYTSMRLALSSRVRTRGSAEALLALANGTSDPDAKAELLLYSKWAMAVGDRRGKKQETGSDFERALNEQIEDAAPGSLIAAVALCQNVSGTMETGPLASHLQKRAEHAGPAHRRLYESSAARLMVLSGRSDTALDLLLAATRSNDGDLASWEALRVAAACEGEWELSAACCDRLAAHSDGAHKAELLEEAALLLLEHSEDRSGAKARLTEAIKLDSSRTPAYARLREIVETEGDMERLAELVAGRVSAVDDPGELALLLHEQACHQRERDDLDGAVTSLKNLLVLKPDHAAGTALVAECYVMLGQWSEAVAALRSVACLDLPATERKNARWAAARYLMEKLGDPESALAELRIIERMGLADEPLLARIAHLAERAGKAEEAIRALTQAAEITDGTRRARYERRAAALHRAALANPQAAMDAYRRALRAVPTDLEAAEALAELLDRGPRLKMAAVFQAAVRASTGTSLDVAAIRKLYRSAVWMEDVDLEFLALSALNALNAAAHSERDRLDRLGHSTVPLPSGPLTPEALGALLPELDAVVLQVLALAQKDLASWDALDAKALGVGKKELVPGNREHAVRNELGRIISIFGLDMGRFYLGGNEPRRIQILPGETNPSWVIGPAVTAPLSLEQRFTVGRQAMAAKLSVAVLDRSPDHGASLLQAMAVASGTSAADSDDIAKTADSLRKALSRSVRREVEARSHASPMDRDSIREFCERAQLAINRAGLLACGDLEVALGTCLSGEMSQEAAARSKAGTDLLNTWLSPSFRNARAEIGLDRETTSGDALGGEGLGSQPAKLESPSGFFGVVAAPEEWEVSVESLLAQVLATAPQPGRHATSNTQLAPLNSEDQIRSRLSLLQHLEARSRGAIRSAVLLSAHELLQHAGETDAARATLVQARDADPENLIALRRVRQEAAKRGAFSEVADLFRREAELPVNSEERGLLLNLAAIIALEASWDLASARELLGQAHAARPRSAATAFLFSALELGQGRTEEGYKTLETAAREWKDPRVVAIMLVEAALAREQSGDLTRARFLFKGAAEADEHALAGWIGLARTARAQKSAEEASWALESLSSHFSDRRVSEAFLRAAARVNESLGGRSRRLMDQLSKASEGPALHALAEVAEGANDSERLEEALSKYAASTRRTERALALCHLSDIRLARGNRSGANESLREAAHADQTLPLVRLLQEEAARADGDVLRLARLALADGLSPLAASARAALMPDGRNVERRMLAEAPATTPADALLRALSLELAAEIGESDEVLSLLEPEPEDSPSWKCSRLIVMSDNDSLAGNATDAMRRLRQAVTTEDGQLIALRRLAQLAKDHPGRGANVWMQEAQQSTGKRAAFAYSMAGRLLQQEKGDALGQYRMALDSDPGYGPASWAVDEIARASGRTDDRRRELLARADAVGDPLAEAESLVRAAFLDEKCDAALLARAFALAPHDRPLAGLLLREVDGLSRAELSILLRTTADENDAVWGRVVRLRAAWMLSCNEDYEGAVEMCRTVSALQAEPDPFAEYLLNRLEPTIGAWSDTKRRLLERAAGSPDDLTRAHTLERLTELEPEGEEIEIPALEQLLEQYPSHALALRKLEIHFMNSKDDHRLADVEAKIARLGHPPDALAHARLGARLYSRLAPERRKEAGDLLCSVFDYAEADLWLAREVAAHTAETKDTRLLSQALAEISDQSEDPRERLSAELRVAAALSEVRSPSLAANRLARALKLFPRYAVAQELLAELKLLGGAVQAAAEDFELAGRGAHAPKRAAMLFHRAGGLFQDQLGSIEKAIRCLFAACEADLESGDAFDRLLELVTTPQDRKRLEDLLNTSAGRGDSEAQRRLGTLHSRKGSGEA